MNWNLPPRFAEQWQAFRANRRLQLGALVILAILAAEGSLRWLEHMEAQETRLSELRDQKHRLQGQSRDKVALEAELDEIGQVAATAKARLWVVPSEAVGQARQKDWLQSMFQQIEVVPRSIVLATPRAYDEKTPSGASASPAFVAAAAPQSAQKPTGIREFRATLVFPFTPNGLEKTLAALEGGEPFVKIESLFASRRERRVELNLAMLMEINPDAPRLPESRSGDADDATRQAAAGAVDMDAAVKTVIDRENAVAGGKP